MSTPTITHEQLSQAEDVALEGVLKRAFLHRLGELGYPAANDDEAATLVEMGFQVAEKLAAAGQPIVPNLQPFQAQNRYAKAAAALGQVAAPSGDAAFQSALALAQDPVIYSALLTIKQAQALAAQAG